MGLGLVLLLGAIGLIVFAVLVAKIAPALGGNASTQIEQENEGVGADQKEDEASHNQPPMV